MELDRQHWLGAVQRLLIRGNDLDTACFWQLERLRTRAQEKRSGCLGLWRRVLVAEAAGKPNNGYKAGTGTAEGRAMFGMLAVLAELQRELIVGNTRDGLAAARARGRKGGRRPKLTVQQARQVQRLYDEGEHTVAQIAEMFRVPRSTVYGHLDPDTVGQKPRAKTA